MEKFKNFIGFFSATNRRLRITSAVIMLLLAFVIFKIGFFAVSGLALFIAGAMIYEYDIKLFKTKSWKFAWDLISILSILILFCANRIYNNYPIYYFSIAFILLFTLSNIINISLDKKHWVLESLPPLYIGFGLMSFLYIYLYSSILSLIYVFVITITTDSGAYFIGSLIGGPKLWEKISPKKTWSGSIGGVLCAFAFGTSYIIFSLWFSGFDHFNSVYIWGLISILLSILSQFGDLFESWLKRINNIKDSSNIIPGHGGVLDRFDSFLFVAPIMALVIAFTKVGYFML